MRERDCTLAQDAAKRLSGETMDLRSMRERAEMLDGSLGIDSSSGTGTRVEPRVPWTSSSPGPSKGGY
jgi:signal transduction histidine kinase